MASDARAGQEVLRWTTALVIPAHRADPQAVVPVRTWTRGEVAHAIQEQIRRCRHRRGRRPAGRDCRRTDPMPRCQTPDTSSCSNCTPRRCRPAEKSRQRWCRRQGGNGSADAGGCPRVDGPAGQGADDRQPGRCPAPGRRTAWLALGGRPDLPRRRPDRHHPGPAGARPAARPRRRGDLRGRAPPIVWPATLPIRCW